MPKIWSILIVLAVASAKVMLDAQYECEESNNNPMRSFEMHLSDLLRLIRVCLGRRQLSCLLPRLLDLRSSVLAGDVGQRREDLARLHDGVGGMKWPLGDADTADCNAKESIKGSMVLKE